MSATKPSTDRPELFAVLRTIDAAANRASEGVRIVEDYARFVLDDPLLTELGKTLRHELTATLEAIPATDRVRSRDTLVDVGTNIETSSEYHRATPRDVAMANCKRAEQGLRTLEEFGKLIDADVARRFEAIRYRFYTLEKAISTVTTARARLADALLYVLVDACESESAMARLCESLVEAGTHVLQLRAKELEGRPLVDRARIMRRITRGTSTLFIMNDRPDVAALADADGVHVGQDDLSLKDTRTIVGVGPIVGVSTHNVEQVRQAVLDGADYIGCGPTFPSQTKSFDAYAGLDFLRAAAKTTTLPAYAIGGIGPANVAEALSTGIQRVVIGAAITKAKDPAQATRDLLQRLKNDHPSD